MHISPSSSAKATSTARASVQAVAVQAAPRRSAVVVVVAVPRSRVVMTMTRLGSGGGARVQWRSLARRPSHASLRNSWPSVQAAAAVLGVVLSVTALEMVTRATRKATGAERGLIVRKRKGG